MRICDCLRILCCKRRVALKLFLFVASFIMLNASGGVLYANIDSPQGALDVAGILPGRYGFMETVSSVKALASLMKQSIEVNEILSRQASLAVPESGAETALKIASAVPRFSGPSGQSISQLMSSRNLLWPVSGYIYSAFGATRGKNRAHGAVDMVIKKGTPIAAAADGVVIVAAEGGKNFKGYGKTVIIDHGSGIHTLYAHCNSLLVKMGQRVKRGEFIATVGRTGRATTDHVHFEVRMAGKKVDPLLYLPSRPELVKAKNWHSKNS